MQFENVESDSVVDQRVAISDDENEYFVAEESRDTARSTTPRAAAAQSASFSATVSRPGGLSPFSAHLGIRFGSLPP